MPDDKAMPIDLKGFGPGIAAAFMAQYVAELHPKSQQQQSPQNTARDEWPTQESLLYLSVKRVRAKASPSPLPSPTPTWNSYTGEDLLTMELILQGIYSTRT